MSLAPDLAGQLIANLTAWASAQDDIRAVIVFGSRARADHPADAWSDMDVLILARNPEPYWRATDWLAHLGPVALHFSEPTPDAQGREVRTLLEGGLDVDLVLAPADAAAGSVRWFYAELLQGGARALVDKDGLLPDLLTGGPPRPDPWPVAAEEFTNLVSDFWFHTVWTAKKVRRGELWVGKACCDTYLKQHLLTMMAWQTRALGRAGTRVWFGGRFLADWADPQAVAALAGAFAHYETEDIWRALGVTADLFAWLARETASALGYDYPARGEAQARELVTLLRADG